MRLEARIEQLAQGGVSLLHLAAAGEAPAAAVEALLDLGVPLQGEQQHLESVLSAAAGAGNAGAAQLLRSWNEVRGRAVKSRSQCSCKLGTAMLVRCYCSLQSTPQSQHSHKQDVLLSGSS